MNAGKQDSASGIATPSSGIKRIVEQIDNIEKIIARAPMIDLVWDFIIVIPIIKNDIASNTKKADETIKCSVYTVSGNTPIPIRASELKLSIHAPVFFCNIFISPSENNRARIPPSITPELKYIAETPSIPRLLKACSVNLNHGECNIASPMQVNMTIGINIPQIPATLIIFIIILLIHNDYVPSFISPIG